MIKIVEKVVQELIKMEFKLFPPQSQTFMPPENLTHLPYLSVNKKHIFSLPIIKEKSQILSFCYELPFKEQNYFLVNWKDIACTGPTKLCWKRAIAGYASDPLKGGKFI